MNNIIGWCKTQLTLIQDQDNPLELMELSRADEGT